MAKDGDWSYKCNQTPVYYIGNVCHHSVDRVQEIESIKIYLPEDSPCHVEKTRGKWAKAHNMSDGKIILGSYLLTVGY